MPHPYDGRRGQTLRTDVGGVAVDRGYVAHYRIAGANAPAADNDGVLAATALTGAAQQITAGITSPAAPRTLTIKGNAAGIAGNVVIHGTNFAGESITETIALNGDAVVGGAKAFRTVTRIDLPAETHPGTDTVMVGWAEALGLPFRLAHDTVLAAYFNGTREATAPTVAVSPTAIEDNTIDLSSALTGQDVDVYLVV